MTEEQLIQKLNELRNLPRETEWVEFKSARNNFNFDDLGKYFSALSNEANLKDQKNGWLVFGVDNNKNVVGTNYRNDPNSLHTLKHDIAQHTNNNITFNEIFEIQLSEGRVILFQIPPAQQGIPTSWKGHFYGRDSDSLVPLNLIELDYIRNQTRILDYSSQIFSEVSLNDLSNLSISKFRSLWYEKSNNRNLLNCPLEQLLSDAELLIGGKLNYASLILLGTKEALSKYLPNAEIIYEYRNAESEARNQARENYRIGFFEIIDKLWDLINSRNGLHHLQEKFLMKDIPYFNKEVIREAILNAVCHRDYQSSGSIFIRQYPQSIIIENPGGFPNGITPDNILYRTKPRNRRIAEIFEKCGLVERSGQGADEMFRKLIEESKPLPDYSRSDNFNVILKIEAKIQDKNFIQFIQNIYKQKQIDLSIDQLLTLDEIRRGVLKAGERQDCIDQLSQQKIIIKKLSKGVTRYSFSKELYPKEKVIEKSKKQLELEKQKEILIQFLKKNEKASLSDFLKLFMESDRNKVYNILRPLKKEGIIEFVGDRKTGYWKLSE